MDTLLLKAQAYIAHDEKEEATKQGPRNPDFPRGSKYDDLPPRPGGEKRKDNRSREAGDQRGPSDHFTEYTLLNASHERVLEECKNNDFKNSSV